MRDSDRLTQQLERHGFHSNQDYSYAMRCLLSADTAFLRCLITESDQPRRCTAFAHALSNALDYEHHRYYEFSGQPQVPEPVKLTPPRNDDEPAGEQPVEELDRIVSEACALSEGEKTVLILDSLHLAPFYQHLRINEFIRSHQWSFNDVQLKAHANNLLIILIASEPLYHSLQQAGFSLWIDSGEEEAIHITTELLDLSDEAQPVLDALKRLMGHLQAYPTLHEYRRLMHDIHVNIHHINDLRTSIYGWVEGIDRRHLTSEYMNQHFEREFIHISTYLDLDANPPNSNH